MKKFHLAILAHAFLLFAAFVPVAHAYQTPQGLDDEKLLEFKEVAKDLRCPTCTGLSVLESDAEFSIQIKERVAEQVKAGKSREEIVQYFVDRYGPWIMREPPKQGFNLTAWLLPLS